MRPLVEPFRRQHLGAGAGRDTLAVDLDLDTDEDLHRSIDRDRAKAKRPGKRYLPFEEGDIAHSEAERHGDQSSEPCVKKCLRMRCTNSVKRASAITSSERG